MDKILYEQIKTDISNPDFNNWKSLILNLFNEYNKHEDKSLIQDIVLRLMSVKDKFSEMKLLNHLIGELGLFPYIEKDKLDLKDTIRQSLFLAPTNDDDITFHIKQAEVFSRIMAGENIVLSAPTSFGKSLVIESIIGSDKFNNIVIVVPTIALIDELKKKFHVYSDRYKIITQSHQSIDERNIFIFTQERVIESDNLDNVDFFIIDEFYKLAPKNDTDSRCDRLNLAFHKLYKNTKRFYMLGPNIDGLATGLEQNLKCSFLKYDAYKTVATDESYYDIREKGKDSEKDIDRDAHLYSLINEISSRGEQTVIYCKSPQRASMVMSKLVDSGIIPKKDIENNISEWLKETYNENWSFTDAVEHGIACHHGKLPRAISSLIVELFNKSVINILVCTSTLIEGVNTNAKNIIIYDDCITKRIKLDSFTFNNIAGRSGRMLKHFVGNVFIFGSKPDPQLPLVDIPIVTQSNNASESMLLQISDELNENGQEKVAKYINQEILPIYIIKNHQSISPQKLLSFASTLIENHRSWHRNMTWNSIYPTYDQLLLLSQLMYDNFGISNMGGGIRSASQLERKLRKVIDRTEDKTLIQDDYDYWHGKNQTYTIDDAVQSIFDFKRNLVGYNLPKIILAISDIQENIFTRYGYSSGNYKAFAYSLESFFEIPALTTLEEFGIPFQISKKIENAIYLTSEDDIDLVISKIKNAYEDDILFNGLSEFEVYMLERAIKYL